MEIKLNPQNQKLYNTLVKRLNEEVERQIIVSRITGRPPHFSLPDEVATNPDILMKLHTLLREEGIPPFVLMYQPHGAYMVCQSYALNDKQQTPLFKHIIQ